MDTPAISDKDAEKVAALEEEAGRVKKAMDLLQQDVERAQVDEASEEIARS